MNNLRPIVLNRRLQTSWSDALPLVQRIFNSSINDSIGTTPTQILFGNAINTERGLFAGSETSQHASLTSMSDWVEKMLTAQADIIAIAQETQRKTDMEHMFPSPKRIRTSTSSEDLPVTEFPNGTFVLVSYPNNPITGMRPPDKLMATLKGPYKVVNSVGSAITVQNLVTNKSETVHISQLREFKFDAAQVDPRTVANVDHQAWDVEKIVSHKGNFNLKSSLSFQVRWKGFTSLDDTWEPWANVRTTQAMVNYLTKLKLQRHIPKSVLVEE
jgi:hypothetical protein